MRVTTPVFVMRRVRWSESSLILTLYSLDHGRISAIARGALRPKSSFYGRLEMLSMVDLSLSMKEGREISTATDADVIQHFQTIRSDAAAFAHSCLFFEWLLLSVSGSEPSHPMFHLIREVLNNFARGGPYWPVLCSGIEKALRLSGFAMEIDSCTRCGRPAPEARFWDGSAGGVVCDECSGNAEKVQPGILAFIRKSRSGRIGDVRRLRLWRGGYRQCFDLMRRFAEIHLDRVMKLKSLSVLEELEDE